MASSKKTSDKIMASQDRFSDIQNHWAKGCIEALAQRQLISGYPDGTFRPNASVTRTEFAVLLAKTFSDAMPVRGGSSFKDVPANHWARQAIEFTVRTGFLSGYPDRTFGLNQPIPRVQVLVAIANGLKYRQPLNPIPLLQKYFDDFGAIPSYAQGAIAAAADAGLAVSYPSAKQLKPNQNTTRGEVAAFIFQALVKSWQISPVLPFVAGNPIARSAQSSAGKVTAEVKNLHLKITRQGQTLYNTTLFNVSSNTLDPSVSVLVQDLDRDGEPEIIVDGYDRATSNFISFIYYYQSTAQKYAVIQQNWGPVAYQLQDINNDGTLDFISGQYPFDIFSENALESAVPLEIWKYQQGQFLKVTLNHLDKVRDRANQLWQDSLNRQRLKQDLKAILATFLAEQYRLNKKREGWYLVRQAYQKNDAQKYFSLIFDALAANDYLSFAFLLEPKFDEMSPFQEGFATVKANGYWGYADYRGTSIVPAQFLGAESFRDGKAWVRLDSQYGYIDNRGNFLIPPQFEATGRDFSEGLLAVKKDNKWGYIDRAGTVVIPFQFDGAEAFSEGLAVVWIGSRYGYVDKQGNIAVKLQLEGGDAFSEGMARVWVDDLVGYIDTQRNFAIPPKFQYGDRFLNGIARVSFNSKWGYIDRAGQFLPSAPVVGESVPLLQPEFDYADAVTDGLMRVRKGDRWGYVDRTGKLVIPLQFNEAGKFQDKLAVVKVGTKFGYIDLSGKLVIPATFDEAETFYGDRAAIQLNRKYGYIDKTGKVVILPQFDEAFGFQEDLARVRIGSKYGYSDGVGTVAIAPQFDQADDFKEGLARVKVGNKWGYIHETGKFIIPPQFDWIDNFDRGLARVRQNGKWGYIFHPLHS